MPCLETLGLTILLKLRLTAVIQNIVGRFPFFHFPFCLEVFDQNENNQDIFLQLPPKKTTSHDVTFCNTGDYLVHLS